MAEDDIVVKLGLDTSDLEAGMGRARALMVEEGRRIAAGLGKVGISPEQALQMGIRDPAQTSALQAYVQSTKGAAAVGAGAAGAAGAAAAAGAGAAAQATGAAGAAAAAAAPGMQQAAGAAQTLAQAQNAVATASNNAGSAFERMLNRMMERVGILYVVHEAIKLITEALTESSAYEAAQVRFENLSTAVEGSANAWEHLRQVARETGISTEELSQAQMSLEKMGVSGGEVGGVMENLAKYAKILGVDIGTVASEWGRLERKEGSVKDMQDLAYATHDINLGRLVNDLAEAQRLAPLLAEQQAQLDRQINRAADDQDRALNRAIEDTDRLRNAQLSVAQAIGVAGEAYKEFVGGGRRGGVAGPATERMKSEMALGEAQLAREGEPSVQQMRAMGMSGKEIYQILMQAAQRYHEQVRIHLQRQEEDQKRVRQQQQEDARENVRLKAAQDLLNAEDKVAQAIEKGIGADTAFGKAMQTSAGLSDLIKEHMKDIVDDSKIINDALKGWNKFALDFIDSLKRIDNIIKDLALTKITGWLGEQGVKAQYEKEHGPGSYDALIHPSKPQWGLVPGNLSMAGLTPQQFMAGSGATPRETADKLAQKQDEANKHHTDAKGLLQDIFHVLQSAFGQ